jgi:hypothetical protein
MQTALHRLLATPVLLVFVWSLLFPGIVMAQDDEWDFGEGEEGWEFGTDDDGAWEFGTEEDDWSEDSWDTPATPTVPSTPAVPVRTGPFVITALFVPSEALPAAQAEQLTQAVLTRLMAIPNVQVTGNESLRMEFDIMGAEFATECAFDPVCIGRYGRQLGLNKVVVGRVNRNDAGQWATTLDLINADLSSVENYRVFATDTRVDAVDAALEVQLNTLFGIRRQVGPTEVARRGPSPAQKAMAWTTLGLGVGAIAVGAVFGGRAGSLEDELTGCPLVPGNDGNAVCSITQVEARSIIDDGRRNATMANVFLGTGLLLTVGSVLLFTVTPGADIDTDAQLSEAPRRPRGIRNVRMAPAFAPGSVGLLGGFEF